MNRREIEKLIESEWGENIASSWGDLRRNRLRIKCFETIRDKPPEAVYSVMEDYYDADYEICLRHDYEMRMKKAKADGSAIPTREEIFGKEAIRRFFSDLQVGRRYQSGIPTATGVKTLSDLIDEEYKEQSRMRQTLRDFY